MSYVNDPKYAEDPNIIELLEKEGEFREVGSRNGRNFVLFSRES